MTAESGHTVLGCGHRFHMLCVVSWFQEQEGTPTCPCCRRQAGRFDNVPVWPEDEEEEEETETEESDDEAAAAVRWLEDADINDNMHIRLNWRRAEGGQWECYTIPTAPDFIWDPSDATDTIPSEISAGAVALQRIWRGWRERRQIQDAALLLSLKLVESS